MGGHNTLRTGLLLGGDSLYTWGKYSPWKVWFDLLRRFLVIVFLGVCKDTEGHKTCHRPGAYNLRNSSNVLFILSGDSRNQSIPVSVSVQISRDVVCPPWNRVVLPFPVKRLPRSSTSTGTSYWSSGGLYCRPCGSCFWSFVLQCTTSVSTSWDVDRILPFLADRSLWYLSIRTRSNGL